MSVGDILGSGTPHNKLDTNLTWIKSFGELYEQGGATAGVTALVEARFIPSSLSWSTSAFPTTETASGPEEDTPPPRTTGAG